MSDSDPVPTPPPIVASRDDRTIKPITRKRIIVALTAAIVADSLQLLLGPFGWILADQLIDLSAAVITNWMLGFHWMLLPTFAIEAIPLIDELPTWTACVAAVIALRKRKGRI
jgi:hypothetical protein